MKYNEHKKAELKERLLEVKAAFLRLGIDNYAMYLFGLFPELKGNEKIIYRVYNEQKWSEEVVSYLEKLAKHHDKKRNTKIILK